MNATPHDPQEPFEAELTDAFRSEHAAIEARRINGLAGAANPQSSMPQAWWSRPILAFGAVVLVVAGAFGALQLLSADDPQPVITLNPEPATEVVPDPTSEPATPEPSPPTAVLEELPTVAAAPPTAVPTPLTNAPLPCADTTTKHIAFVTDVAADDPDGGLVVHDAAGVSAPVVGVLPFYDTVRIEGPCEQLESGAIWRLISSASVSGWVNARFLSVDVNTPPGFAADATIYQVFFTKEPEAQADWSVTAPVTRYYANRTDIVNILLEELAAGPTAREAEAGFSHPFYLRSILCEGITPLTMDDTTAILQVCPQGSAGVGEDVRRISTLTDTFENLPGIDRVAVLNGETGHCLGAVADDLRACLNPPLNDEDPCATDPRNLYAGTETQLTGFDPAAPDRIQFFGVTPVGPACVQVQIVLGEGLTADDWLTEATSIGDGVSVRPEGEWTVVQFPSSVSSQSPREFPSLVGSLVGDSAIDYAAFLVAGTVDGDGPSIWFKTGTPHQVLVSTLGARIVINAELTDGGIGVPLQGTVAGASTFPFLVEAARETADGVAITGFGRGSDVAQAFDVWDSDGQSVEFTRSEVVSSPDLVEYLPEERFSWRPYTFVISGLAPGDYQLALGACAQCEAARFPFTVPAAAATNTAGAATTLPTTDPAGLAVVPFLDESTGLTISKAHLTCESEWLSPSLILESNDPTINLNGIAQTISFVGADGVTYSATDDVVGFGIEEYFGEYATPPGAPTSVPGAWEPICEEPTWPMTVVVRDGRGAEFTVSLAATVDPDG